jgi:hypothetical protein
VAWPAIHLKVWEEQHEESAVGERDHSAPTRTQRLSEAGARSDTLGREPTPLRTTSLSRKYCACGLVTSVALPANSAVAFKTNHDEGMDYMHSLRETNNGREGPYAHASGAHRLSSSPRRVSARTVDEKMNHVQVAVDAVPETANARAQADRQARRIEQLGAHAPSPAKPGKASPSATHTHTRTHARTRTHTHLHQAHTRARTST